ncbi:SGNH hydrolase domain-containing protein [Streptomyces shenzhenensis]|uniref:SGNH hydrolase domain-containing protein n=1 Tax=Streptomyces shenzhenensis TaxID=943815 RepID=UPI0034110901
MFTRSSRRWAGVTVPALLLAVAGCGVWGNDSAQGTPAAAPQPSLSVPASAPPSSSLGSAPPPVGEAELSPAVQGKKVLVVGDSWAEYFGNGMAKVASGGNVIVNAGLGGCGIMMPDTVQGGKKSTAACLKWPKEWPQYMKQYKPDAVLLRTANWDMTPQSFDHSGVELSMEHVPFRQRFFRNMGRAIDILTQNGTPVYLTNARIEAGGWKTLSLKMNDAVQELADKYKDKGVHLLDLRAQLCNDSGCPPVVDGHKLYDAIDHPADWSRDRIATWMLNTMFAGGSAGAGS